MRLKKTLHTKEKSSIEKTKDNQLVSLAVEILNRDRMLQLRSSLLGTMDHKRKRFGTTM
jgi:hypothetical protein